MSEPAALGGGSTAALVDRQADTDLPKFPTSFVGREAETATLCQLLGAARLVTITGPGGSGKTRLAHRVAQSLRDRHGDGVVSVELTRVVRDAEVASEVAAACGLAQSPAGLRHAGDDRAPASARRTTVVVLDNAAHVLDGVALLAAGSPPGRPVVLLTPRRGPWVWATRCLADPGDGPPGRGAGADNRHPGRCGRPVLPAGTVRLAHVRSGGRRAGDGLRGVPTPRRDPARHRAGRRPRCGRCRSSSCSRG